MSKLMTRLLPDLSITLYRFPIPILVCLFLFLFNIAEIEDFFNFSSDERWEIYFGAGAAFLASGGVHFLGQSRRYLRTKTIGLAILAGVIAFVLGYFNQTFSVTALFLLPALVLWVMIAGYLRAEVPFSTVWLFNVKFVTAVVLATIAGSIFFASGAAILESLKYLFGLKFSNDAYDHLFNIAIVAIGPVYGMSLLPLDLDEKLNLADSNNFLWRGATIVINYILVPVLLFYVVILHVYAAKIGFSLALPKGKVGMMVLLFGIGGTAIWLIAKPWAETGSRVLKLFSKFWYWFTIIPTVLLIIAAWQRAEEYGITPERYGLFLIAIWLAMMTVYFAVRKSKAQPQVILGSMMVLLLTASFGPWGAQGFSISNQLNRLEVLLIDKGFLKNGKVIVDLPDEISVKTKRAINSSVRFFQKQNRLDVLQPYFEGQEDNPFDGKVTKWKLARQINARFSGNHQQRPSDVKINYYHSNASQTEILKPVMLAGPFYFSSIGSKNIGNKVKVSLTKNGFQVSVDGNTMEINNRKLLLAAQGKSKTSSLKIPINGSEDIVLLVKSLQGSLGKKKSSINRLEGWLLLPLPLKNQSKPQTVQ